MGKKRDLRALATSLKELATMGFPVDLSVAIPEDRRGDVVIEQVEDPTIFVLQGGLTVYLLNLILINGTAKTIYLRDLKLRVPWENSALEMVSELRNTGKNHQNCFPRLGDLRASTGQGNRRGLMEHGTLTTRPLQGSLFAVGGPLPKDFRHGTTREARVVACDMSRLEYRGTVNFWIDRLTYASKKAVPETQFHVGTTVGYASQAAARATMET
jgi:hypothetical protein